MRQSRWYPDLSHKMLYSDLVNRRHQLVILSSTSSATVSFRNSQNIPNGAKQRKDCRLECYSLWQMYSPALGTRWTWSSPTIPIQVNLLEIMYGLVQIKSLILIFSIHNMFGRNCTKKHRTKVYKMINTNTACSLSPKFFRCSL